MYKRETTQDIEHTKYSDKVKDKLYTPINIEQILKQPVIQFIINILFGVSTACLTAMLINPKYTNIYAYVLITLASFITSEIIVFKYKFLKKTFADLKLPLFLASCIIGIYFLFYNCSNTSYEIGSIISLKIAGILAVPSAIIFVYWLYKQLIKYAKSFIKSLDKGERNFLIIAGLILAMGIAIIYNITNIFYSVSPTEDRYKYNIYYNNPESRSERTDKFTYEYIKYLYNTNQYDTVYTSDTGPLLNQDVYNQINANENNIRQPLFGVFAMPFTIIPKMIASIFPNISNLYAILIAIVQMELLLVTSILITRLMKIKGAWRLIFWIVLLFSFPTLLFMLNLEQYTFGVFYLITFIYMTVFNKSENDRQLCYIAATGTMLTTGILFPLLGEKKNIKASIKKILCTFFMCIAIIIISGKIGLIVPESLQSELNWITLFSQKSEHTTTDRVNMYTNFAKNLIIYSPFEEELNHEAAAKMIKYDDTFIQVRVFMPKISQTDTLNFSTTGATILILAILGFVFNRKDAFAKICFTWLMFSMILLIGIGWGTSENGLILYTLYFSWAFLALMYKFIYKIFQKIPKIGKTITALGIIPIATINLYGIYQIILFGVNHYPNFIK